MSHDMRPMRGKVRGVGEVRDKFGNLKGTLVFEGETPLTEDELRKALDVPAEQPPNCQEDK